MKVESSVAEVREPFAKFIEVGGAAAKGHGHFHAFAKIETLEARLRRKLRLRYAEIANDTAKIGSQCCNGSVIADVESCELLGQIVPVRGRKRPLREIVGKAFCEEVMHAKGL